MTRPSAQFILFCLLAPVVIIYLFKFQFNFAFPFAFWNQNDVYSIEEQDRPFTRHIVAVGDLHGDYPNALRVLRFSNVIDEFGDWSGEVDCFVQTGDIIDRGDDTIRLFALMDKLRGQAASTDGVVLTHLGNHEWMNAIGDWRYVYPTEVKTFGTASTRQKVISTGFIGRSWAHNYTTASRLPLHPSLGPPNTDYSSNDAYEDGPLSHSALSFVHGGLSPTYPGLTPFPSYINALSSSLLSKLQQRNQPPPHPPHPYPGMPLGTTPEETLMYGADGPVWYRGWALGSDKKVCKEIEGVLAKTGTRRMIMGHTPDFSGIKSRCGGKIIIIDTGISHAYGGVLSALSIHYTLAPTGKHQVWKEREVVSALYPDQRVVLVDEERQVLGDFSGY
jgi:hypothetical protein